MNLEILQQLIGENKSTYQIAKSTNKSQTTVRYWLNKYNLKTTYNESTITETHKTCAKCNKNKLHKEFYGKFQNKQDHNLSSYCKTCSNFAVLKRQQLFKQNCIDYKGGKCSVCAYDKCNAALEFHHLDPNQKDFSIADSNSVFTNEVKHELDKCILLCANCHREIHSHMVAAIGLEPT